MDGIGSTLKKYLEDLICLKYVRRSLCKDCLYLFFKNFLEEDPDDVLHDNEKEDEDNDTSRNT